MLQQLRHGRTLLDGQSGDGDGRHDGRMLLVGEHDLVGQQQFGRPVDERAGRVRDAVRRRHQGRQFETQILVRYQRLLHQTGFVDRLAHDCSPCLFGSHSGSGLIRI